MGSKKDESEVELINMSHHCVDLMIVRERVFCLARRVCVVRGAMKLNREIVIGVTYLGASSTSSP